MQIKAESTTLNLEYSFFALIAFMLLFCDTKCTVCSLTASFCHEQGHIAAMIMCGEKIKGLSFSCFGIVLDRAGYSSLSYKKEAVIAFSGIFVNLACVIVSKAVLHFQENESLRIFMWVNVAIAVFNLLPCEPLDGARGLKALLLLRTTEKNADFILAVTSGAVCLALIFLCGFSVFSGKINASMMLILFYLIFLRIKNLFELKKRKI